MDQVKKMFQAVINGQSAMKAELIAKIDGVDKKFSGKFESLDKKIDRVEKNLTTRIDKIGLQVARLEDDAPTREEHDNLGKRVTKVESRISPAQR